VSVKTAEKLKIELLARVKANTT